MPSGTTVERRSKTLPEEVFTIFYREGDVDVVSKACRVIGRRRNSGFSDGAPELFLSNEAHTVDRRQMRRDGCHVSPWFSETQAAPVVEPFCNRVLIAVRRLVLDQLYRVYPFASWRS